MIIWENKDDLPASWFREDGKIKWEFVAKYFESNDQKTFTPEHARDWFAKYEA